MKVTSHKIRRCLLVAGVLFVVVGALALWQRSGAQDRQFNPQTVIRRPFRPIIDAPMMTAAEAQRKLRPGELVVGVEVDGHARAYPINMLTGPSREIINDTLGGRNIAATW